MIHSPGSNAHSWRYAERLAGFDVLLVCSCGELLRKTIPDGPFVDLDALLDSTDALPEDGPRLAGPFADEYASGWRDRRAAIEAAAGR